MSTVQNLCCLQQSITNNNLLENDEHNLRNPAKSKHDSYMHNKEEDYTGFGGIDICNSKEVDNAIESLYKGLIDKNFKVLNLEGVNAKL